MSKFALNALTAVLLIVFVQSFAFAAPDNHSILPGGCIVDTPDLGNWLNHPGPIIPAKPIPPRKVIPSQPIDLGGATLGVPTHRRIGARYDIVNQKQSSPGFLIIDPNDNQQIVVRWTGGTTQCFGAYLKIEETPTSVKVVLVNGTLPEAGRFCSMIALQLELVGRLQQPLGNRMLTPVGDFGGVPIPNDPMPNLPNPGGLPTAESYINLPLDQAIARAKQANQRYRIGSIDRQGYPMTTDYIPGRVTFTVNNGIVTQCTGG